MKGFRLRNIVALFLFVLLGASVLVAHVWKQNAYVRLSKESARLAREHKALRDSIALLEMQAGELREPARLERLARARFGLEYGRHPVPVYPAGAARPADGALARTGAASGTPAPGGADGGRGGARIGKAAWPTRGL